MSMVAPIRTPRSLGLAALPAALLVIFSITIPVCAVAGPGAPVHGPGISGDIRHHPAFASALLAHSRDIWVYLPPGYAAGAPRRYPVLYVQDGNNVFDPSRAFLGREWGLDETLEKLIRAGEVPPIVMVAVANTPDRIAEYTTRSGTVDGRVVGGDGGAYLRFLVTELKPFIDRTYRTRPDPGSTAILGSSLGGLISLYAGIVHPETFGLVAALSPSLWWDDRGILQDARALRPGLRLYCDMGHHEGDRESWAANLENLRALRSVLESVGYRAGDRLGYHEDPDGSHDEPSWARRVPAILRYLFR